MEIKLNVDRAGPPVMSNWDMARAMFNNRPLVVPIISDTSSVIRILNEMGFHSRDQISIMVALVAIENTATTSWSIYGSFYTAKNDIRWIKITFENDQAGYVGEKNEITIRTSPWEVVPQK